jgi:glycerophosphoryl diester phosphodiesterase
MILWSHRGLVETKEQENTITALDNSFKAGYRNIEFDIWFLNNQLLTKHDEPTKEELANNKLVSLKEFISRYGTKLQYWMDFKNLTLENIDAFLPVYKKIIDEVGIKYNSIWFTPYEPNWEIAMVLQAKARKAMPGINNMVVMDPYVFKKEKTREYYKILQDNNIKNLSIYYEIIDEQFLSIFKDINMFVWTVDNLEEYKRLKNLGIMNICTNKIQYSQV